ncbi:AMP-binding enzyme family protein [Mycobacterium kansasii]|uniref:AMP-binding enzyme family protein n=1 Tax=Mycobacterium kansasii TaxID=1768 RepID=A0A1V3XTW7_MYCKA|nr:AMP-binding enzyme family protein [Mycobacterium kansasii]
MQTNLSFQAGGEVATQTERIADPQAVQSPNGTATRFAMSESSLIDLLQKAAGQYPNRAAYKFIDYEVDPKGFTETLTWWQVYRRATIVADELRICGSSGDRVAILAPQGLEYIVAFLGALQAGLIAVPLPVPQFGIHDERISAALRDSLPTVILTTSSVVDEVVKYVPHARARRAGNQSSSRSTRWTWTRRGNWPPPRPRARARPTSSTHRGRPARPPVLSCRTRTSSAIAYS